MMPYQCTVSGPSENAMESMLWKYGMRRGGGLGILCLGIVAER